MKIRLGTILLPVLVVLFVGYEVWSHVRVRPPERIDTFAEFMEWRAETKDFYKLQLGMT